MTEWKRLRESADDPFELDVLRSVDRDAPGEAARRRALTALGLTGGPSVTSAATAAAKTTGAVTGTLLSAKWLGVGAVGLAAVVGAIAYGPKLASKPASPAPIALTSLATARNDVPPAGLAGDAGPRAKAPAGLAGGGASNEPTTSPAARQAPPEPVPTVEATRRAPPGDVRAPAADARPPNVESRAAVVAPAPTVAAEVTPLVSSGGAPASVGDSTGALAPSPAVVAAATASASASSPPPSTLAAEVTLLERARAALRANDLVTASSALDDYDAKFTTRVLGAQAIALRVEVLVRKGDRARARALGQRFLDAHPDSPTADRVRSLVRPAPGE